MKIVLEKEEAEKHFHNALCNGSQIRDYGLHLDYADKDYKAAKKSLDKKEKSGEFKSNIGICCEDVWMEILRLGGKLILVDEENGMGNKSITLKQVHSRVAKTPICHLMDAINENDDGDTADCIIQTVFYGEVIFG
jgi:hypothetical protein